MATKPICTDADLEALAKAVGNKVKVAWVKLFPGKKVQGPYALEITRHGTVLFRVVVPFSDEAWEQARQDARTFLLGMFPPAQATRRPDDNIPLP